MSPDELDRAKAVLRESENLPSEARVYDYFLGGAANFEVDRAFAEARGPAGDPRPVAAGELDRPDRLHRARRPVDRGGAALHQGRAGAAAGGGVPAFEARAWFVPGALACQRGGALRRSADGCRAGPVGLRDPGGESGRVPQARRDRRVLRRLAAGAARSGVDTRVARRE